MAVKRTCHFVPCALRALKSSQHSLCSLLIVDTPGFQNPRLAKRECGSTFEDLCHNYTQERLQSLFYQRTFVQELERYKEVKRILCAHIHPHFSTLFQSSSHLFLSLPFVYSSLSDISTPIVCVHASDKLSVPPVTSCDKPKWFMCYIFSLAMLVFTSSVEIKVKSLTAAFERHAQLHSRGVAP